MHLEIHGQHIASLGIRLMTTAAVIAEIVEFAIRIRKSSGIFRLKVFCVVKPNRRLILPARFSLSLSEKFSDDQICTM